MKKIGIQPNKYYLIVSRLEPENNVELLIQGYIHSKINLPLVVVGNLLETAYVDELRANAIGSNVLFLGGIYDKNKLAVLRYSCKAYLHGHSVGGYQSVSIRSVGFGKYCVGS